MRHFRASATAGERSTSGFLSAAERNRLNAREVSQAQAGAALLKPFGISCEWPGLFPSFTVKGYSYHTVRAALSAAVSIKVQS